MGAGSKCPNCGATMNCSCQLRTASNGVTVCSQCVSKYEKELGEKRIKRRQETT
tara:strand:- start:1664 stop:1825 length:162 start_codon:yes stop_codon:yes gene_type:complete